ncbi:MAG: hypothetical protein ACI9X0_001737, partial [Kiritimatiellia bacterium]
MRRFVLFHKPVSVDAEIALVELLDSNAIGWGKWFEGTWMLVTYSPEHDKDSLYKLITKVVGGVHLVLLEFHENPSLQMFVPDAAEDGEGMIKWMQQVWTPES